MGDRQFLQQPLAGRRQMQTYFAPVIRIGFADHGAAFGKPVHQFDRAMVPDLQAFRDSSNSRLRADRNSLDGQQ